MQIKEVKRPEIKEITNAYNLVELTQEYLKWAERQRVHVTKKIWVKPLGENKRRLRFLTIEECQTRID